MQCTFSAESVVLTLSNWASHSEICELHILVRVDKTVSARHVSATKSIRVIGLFSNSTCGHIWGRWGRRGRWPHPPPWRSAACWRPRQTRPCSAPWPGAASPANIYQWQCEDMRRYLPWALGKCVDKSFVTFWDLRRAWTPWRWGLAHTSCRLPAAARCSCGRILK